MKKQNGFTLIELIMVIVILGILSAFALPRFANLSDSAQEAALEGARASVKSATAIVHAASLIADNASAATGTVEVDGGDAAIVFGYPAVNDGSNLNIDDVAQIEDFNVALASAPFVAPATAGTLSMIVYSTVANGEECFVYVQAADATTVARTTALGTIAGLAAGDTTLATGDTCTVGSDAYTVN